MAYITQYDVDMQKQSRMNQGLQSAVQGFSGMEENRQRALAQKRAEGALGLEYASQGATPEMIAQANSGDLSGIQGLYAQNAAYKKEQEKAKLSKQSEIDDLNKRHKESEIARNESMARESNKSWDDSKEGKAYKAKAAFDAEIDKSKNANKINGKNVQEFNGRMQNILGEAEQLKSLINNKGTYETFGPHNANLAQKIDSIAIDAAKLFDPESVARDSEVAAFRKMLFEPGSLTTSNGTAIGTIDGFKKLVQDRASRSRGEEVASDLTPDQKLQRYQLLKAKQAGVAQGGN